MSSWFYSLSRTVETGWVWVYTAGMSPSTCGRRREELACDHFEHANYAASERWSKAALTIDSLRRWLFGMPADLTWRAGLGRTGLSRDGLPDLAGALLVVVGLFLCLPFAVMLMLSPGAAVSSAGLTLLLMAIVVGFGFGGIVLYDSRPVAGTVVISIGMACISLALWYSVIAPAAGLIVAGLLVSRLKKSSGIDKLGR